jgi:hypothetical protein
VPKKSGRKVQEDALEAALAILIKNTRTKKRYVSLTELAASVDLAAERVGGLRDLADRLGLSPKMLRQFLAVRSLTPSVRRMFAERRLDSVDMVVHLRMLSPPEQSYVAREAASGHLQTADIRAICEYRKEHPKAAIAKVVERVKATRNIKQYIVDFVVRDPQVRDGELRRRFAGHLGAANIVSLQLSGSLGRLILNKMGRSRLRDAARSHGLSQAEAIYRIVNEEL